MPSSRVFKDITRRFELGLFRKISNRLWWFDSIRNGIVLVEFILDYEDKQLTDIARPQEDLFMTDARPGQTSKEAERRATPSAMADLPIILKGLLLASINNKQRKKSVLLSSNSLGNRFILEKWGIRPSQRRRNKNLFSISRRHARKLFRRILNRGRFDWTTRDSELAFGVYMLDEIRGNLILGFVQLKSDSPWNI